MDNGTATFLADLTAALVGATILGSLARLVGVTPILAYVVTGIIIGPFTPGYHTSNDSLSGLGELGLILLLFSLGLGFSARELKSVGGVPMAGNIALMGAFGVAAWGIASALHFSHPVTLALAFTLSSTAIGAALLQEFGLLDSRPGRSALALLVAQDLIAILMLVLTTTPPEQLSAMGLAIPVAKAVLFVVIALAIGATLLHRFFIAFLRRASREGTIAFCTALALVAAWLGHLAGLSFEFGAFVAGAVTSEAAGSRIVQSIVAPFRELFVMLFFVSIGTFVDVKALGASWQAIVIIGVLLALLRAAGWFGLARIVKQPVGTALALGVALVPLGEFNVVLANSSYLAQRLNVNEYGTIIGATLLSIAIAAVAARLLAPNLKKLNAAGAPAPQPFTGSEIVILGYGRVGKTVAALCRRAGIPFAVVEADVDALRAAQQDGVEVQYGDGADPHVVERVLSPRTTVILSTIPDTAANAALARRLSGHPRVHVIVRAERLREVPALRKAGAKSVLVPEAEGAFGFAHSVLEKFGLSEDRIDALIREQRATLTY